MRKIIRYVFITLMLVCGLILALPFAGFRKNLDAELSKPISKITQDNNNPKKNIQLFNILGIALNNPSDQMVLIAQDTNNSNPDKNPDKLVYISYVVKADKSSGKAGSNNTTDFSGQSNQTSKQGYSPLIAAGKSPNDNSQTPQSSSETIDQNSSTKAITKQSGTGIGGNNDNDKPPLGSLPMGDSNYFVAFLLGLMTLYKFKKTSLI